MYATNSVSLSHIYNRESGISLLTLIYGYIFTIYNNDIIISNFSRQLFAETNIFEIPSYFHYTGTPLVDFLNEQKFNNYTMMTVTLS